MSQYFSKVRQISSYILFVALVPTILFADSKDAISDVSLDRYNEILSDITSREQTSITHSSSDDVILNPQAVIQKSDVSPLDVITRRIAALIKNGNLSTAQKKAFSEKLSALTRKVSTANLAKQKSTNEVPDASELILFDSLRALRKVAMLSDPLIDFDTLLFAGIVKPGGSYHMCDQYLGWNAKDGGGLFLLTGIKSGNTRAINLLKDVTVTSGRLKGKSLDGGAVLSPDLSFDGKKVVFAWTSQREMCYHIFSMNIDGTNLVQLTDGEAPDNGNADESHNDFDPCFLPSGRIVFISERRGGYGRCHPRNVPTYTLYSMKEDGSDITCLSYHETNEWHPSVNNQGQIVYTRWDYLDRDDCIAHHLWLCDPDGCNPRAPHGNYPVPHTTMEGSGWGDGRSYRPNGEWNIRAIPGTLSKYVATAGGHHAHSFGELIVIDINKKDDNKMAQIKGITTDNTRWTDKDGPWGTAWPLSEDLFLCNYNNRIVLLDEFGNREDLYSSDGSFRPIDPIPVKPRKKPPEIAEKTWQGEREGLEDHRRAVISVMNVYNSDLPLENEAKIKEMRIIQVFPQYTPLINQVRIGYASESLARMVLGTVPVEEDGSVYCEAPVGKEVYFQLIDENGLAVQSMRAGTFVHPGEHLSCFGCHEDKWESGPGNTMPSALGRDPSPLEPEVGGVEPVNFYRLAKPVLDEKCAPCHRDKRRGPDMSYGSLEEFAFWWPGPGNPYVNGDILTPKHGGSRTIPGKFGAKASKLFDYLTPDHNDVELTDEEFRRITLWLDCNSNELGAYVSTSDQKRGNLVWPKLDCDPENPTGVESDRPVSTYTEVKKQLPEIFTHKAEAPRVRYLSTEKTLCIDNIRFGGKLSVDIFDIQGRRLFTNNNIRSVQKSISIDMREKIRSAFIVVRISSGSNEFSYRVISM